MKLLAAIVLASAALSAQQIKIVDAHIHHNGEVAFLEKLTARLEQLDGMGFILVQPEHLDQVKQFMAKKPGRLVGFGDVSPDDPKALELIDRFAKAGFKGLGEISNTLKPFDHPSYTAYYDRANKHGMMLLFHTGIVNRPDPDKPQDISVDRLRVTLIDNIARRYPKINIIGAHLGNPDYAWAGEIARWNPNVWFDLTGSTLIKKQEDYSFFKSIFWWSAVASPHTPSGQASAFERVVFASDIFGGEVEELDRSLERYKRMLQVCGVSPEAQKNIFAGTALRLAGIKQ